MPEINNEFSADQEKQMRSEARAARAPMNILPSKQSPGKVGTIEGVNVAKELSRKGEFSTTPKVTPQLEGLY